MNRNGGVLAFETWAGAAAGAESGAGLGGHVRVCRDPLADAPMRVLLTKLEAAPAPCAAQGSKPAAGPSGTPLPGEESFCCRLAVRKRPGSGGAAKAKPAPVVRVAWLRRAVWWPRSTTLEELIWDVASRAQIAPEKLCLHEAAAGKVWARERDREREREDGDKGESMAVALNAPSRPPLPRTLYNLLLNKLLLLWLYS